MLIRDRQWILKKNGKVLLNRWESKTTRPPQKVKKLVEEFKSNYKPISQDGNIGTLKVVVRPLVDAVIHISVFRYDGDRK